MRLKLLLIGLLVLSGTVSTMLALRLAKLERPRPPAGLLRVGTLLPDLAGTDLNGNPIRVLYSDARDTVLLVLEPTCRFCERNMPAWQELVRNTHGYRFVVVSTADQSLGPFLSKYDLLSPTVVRVRGAATATFFASIPATVVVGADGKVRKVWIGSFGTAEKHAVGRFFGVVL